MHKAAGMKRSGSYNVRGLSELRKLLLSLPSEFVSKNGGPVKQALSAATEPIRELADKLIPKDTGRAQMAIYKFRDRDPKRSGLTERYVVGVRRGKLGKKKREMQTVRGIFGIGLVKARTVREKQVLKENEAPYARFFEFGTSKQQAQPFMRPAFDMNHRSAIITFESELRSRVLKIVKRLRRKPKRVR